MVLPVLLKIARYANSVDNEGTAGLVRELMGQPRIPGADL